MVLGFDQMHRVFFGLGQFLVQLGGLLMTPILLSGRNEPHVGSMMSHIDKVQEL